MRLSAVTGTTLGDGVAAGVLVAVPSASAETPEAHLPTTVSSEMNRFRAGVESLAEELRRTVAKLEAEALEVEAEVLHTHLLLLLDAGFHSRVEAALRAKPVAAEEAVNRAIAEAVGRLESSGSELFDERAADLRDLEAQLLDRLGGALRTPLTGILGRTAEPIVAVPELVPSLTLEGRRLGVRGFVVERGTAFSHGVILARSAATPVLRVPDLEVVRSMSGRDVLLDATAGELVVQPAPDEVAARSRPAADPGPTLALAETPLPARVWVNITSPDELEEMAWHGIEGVGLYRTETVFMQHGSRSPGERRQLLTYRRVFERCGRRPVVMRTIDIGGDKPVSFMRLGPQDNPYLGLRAHRLYAYHPELLITQLRAFLRAAAGDHHLRILFPMVETIDAWRHLRSLVDEAVDSLRCDGLEFQHRHELGVLIETPSAVWSFDELLEEADFASVGSNDLVQYLFAAERGNANVAPFYRPAHPVVLRIIQRLVASAREAAKSLGLCGEVASDPYLLPLLVGLGIENLSVSAAAAREVLATLAHLDVARCRELADRACGAATADEVDDLLREWHPDAVVARRVPIAGAATMDPVCGMEVSTGDNPYVATNAGGTTVYFCSARCREQYQRESHRRP